MKTKYDILSYSLQIGLHTIVEWQSYSNEKKKGFEFELKKKIEPPPPLM
jgi:hypothetical protein